MKKQDVTEDDILALERKLMAMKATGMYDGWREQLRKDAEAFEASPRGRFERFIRRIQGAWWRVTGKLPR